MTNHIGNVILFVLTVGATLCVAVYWKAPWHISDVGRQAMSFMAALCFLLIVLSIRNIFGPFPGYDVVRIITYAVLGITVWWRLYLLLKFAQLDKEDAK